MYKVALQYTVYGNMHLGVITFFEVFSSYCVSNLTPYDMFAALVWIQDIK